MSNTPHVHAAKDKFSTYGSNYKRKRTMDRASTPNNYYHHQHNQQPRNSPHTMSKMYCDFCGRRNRFKQDCRYYKKSQASGGAGSSTQHNTAHVAVPDRNTAHVAVPDRNTAHVAVPDRNTAHVGVPEHNNEGGFAFMFSQYSGATDHIVNTREVYSAYAQLTSPLKINVAKNEASIQALGRGPINVTTNLGVHGTIENVLYSPEVPYNLLSVNRMQQAETVYCNATFDSYLCWPPTAAGAVARQHCPPARLSDTSHFAYRRCGPGGLWLGRQPNVSSPLGWTNYTPCFPLEVQNLFVKVYDDERVAQLKFEIAQRTRYMEIAGFSLSLVALAVSLIIFSHYRSLRNNRTRIHKSLFSAMVLQVLIRLTVYIDQALVRSWRGDYAPHDNATLRGIDNMPYLCETSYILLEYAITVMFMWMFIEGLYLHNVVTANALREGISHMVYYATGWGLPVILTALWAAMSALHYGGERVNTCWYGYNFSSLYWIVQGPRLGVIMINLVFLLNIMKVLIVKLRSSKSSELEKIRKAVRAALVLLPLLGITNVINMTEAPLYGSVWKFALWSYSTHFLRSFQGFFIALIYCFLNGEVRQAVKKHYTNYMAMRGGTRRHRDSFFNFLSSSGDHKPTRAKNKKSDEMEFAESLQPQGETNSVQAHVTETV